MRIFNFDQAVGQMFNCLWIDKEEITMLFSAPTGEAQRFRKGFILKAYRKISSISRTKSQNLNVSCLLLQWSLPNPLKPGVKLRMKM